MARQRPRRRSVDSGPDVDQGAALLGRLTGTRADLASSSGSRRSLTPAEFVDCRERERLSEAADKPEK